jgi:hypothetical protein
MPYARKFKLNKPKPAALSFFSRYFCFVVGKCLKCNTFQAPPVFWLSAAAIFVPTCQKTGGAQSCHDCPSKMQENAFPLSWACWEQSFASSFIIKSCDLINYEWHFNGTAAARAWAQLTCFKRSLRGNLSFQAVRISQQSQRRACNADCEWASFCACRGERKRERAARTLVPAQLVFSRFLSAHSVGG